MPAVSFRGAKSLKNIEIFARIPVNAKPRVEDLCRIGIQFGAEWIQSTLLLAAKKRRKDRDGP
jgi:hypothetical protein